VFRLLFERFRIFLRFLFIIKYWNEEMKKIFLNIILLWSFTIFSCSTEVDEFMNEGTIIGQDVRECACCGGYFIDINKNRFRFYELPDNSNFDLENPAFPIYVKLDWAMHTNLCLGDEIIISRIEIK
jgi:hypothetical protein